MKYTACRKERGQGYSVSAECGKIITNLKNTKVDIDITPIRLLKKLSTI